MRSARPRLLRLLAWLCLGLPQLAWCAQTLFAVGDTGDCLTPGTAQVAAALKRQPGWQDAILVLAGDLAYPDGTRQQFEQCHLPHFAAFRRLAVPGNHDWNDPGAQGFYSAYPEPHPRLAELAGPWRLLLLDSNLAGAAWIAQLQWLTRTLEDNRGRCLIGVWHHPRWSSGIHGNQPAMAPLWNAMVPHASFTLHGHDHHFEAVPPLDVAGQPKPDGLPSFIVGNGGSPLYGFEPPFGNGRAVVGRWGFLRIDLQARGYHWRAYDTEDRLLGQGEGRCRASAR